MTQRVTVSLPDDVAARLQHEGNASAYVTEAVRQRMNRENTSQILAQQGFTTTPEGRARARQRLAQADQEWPAVRREALRDQLHRLRRPA